MRPLSLPLRLRKAQSPQCVRSQLARLSPRELLEALPARGFPRIQSNPLGKPILRAGCDEGQVGHATRLYRRLVRPPFAYGRTYARLRPSDLALYIARSAARSNDSASASSALCHAPPTLTVTDAVRPSSPMGIVTRATARRTFSATLA